MIETWLIGSVRSCSGLRAAHLPSFDITLIERPTADNPLGVKGSGQAGCIGAPQTVMAAVLDALRDAGVTSLDMPATPERVWRALNASSPPHRRRGDGEVAVQRPEET